MADNRQADLVEKTLEALNRAALAIASELDFEKVLKLIVDSARELAQARYAALGIPAESGRLVKFVHSGMPPETVAKMPHLPRGKGLLGAIITTRQPIRVPDIAADARAIGFPPGHPSMQSFLGVPIMGGNEILGNLYLTDKIGAAEFSAVDERLVAMLAAHAAIAIQNAQLYEQVERLAVLEERTRIGMDLHDGVIQSIYAVGLTLESTRLALPDGSRESALLLDAAVAGLNDAIRDIRNFILDLRPRRFRGDLNEGLAQIVREFQANTMVPVAMTVGPDMESLPLPLSRAIFLTTQEGLANIARHARAEHVTLTLLRTDSAVLLNISDDGRGFDVEDESRRVGHGLANMQARAEGLGGVFSVKSVRNEGTSITLRAPI